MGVSTSSKVADTGIKRIQRITHITRIKHGREVILRITSRRSYSTAYPLSIFKLAFDLPLLAA